MENSAKFFCNICNTLVIEHSKHCAKCNRCSFEFDHHCIWVSNDIGRLNYVLFLRMLIFMNMTFFLQIFLNIRALVSEESRYLDHDDLMILNYFTLVLVTL